MRTASRKLLIVAAVSILLLMIGLGSRPVHNREYYESRGEVVWDVPTDAKLIALTFDDGPNRRTTPLILDLLKQYDAKATFFVVGNRIHKYKDIIKREVAEGHEVANHTYNHIFFNQNIDQSVIAKEILQTQAELMETIGQTPHWFRPPGGFINERVVHTAKELGLTVILWSWHQDSHDWRQPGVDKIVNTVVRNARNGDIVLLHDSVKGSMQTVEALDRILFSLKDQGYRFVTVSELTEHRKLRAVVH